MGLCNDTMSGAGDKRLCALFNRNNRQHHSTDVFDIQRVPFQYAQCGLQTFANEQNEHFQKRRRPDINWVLVIHANSGQWTLSPDRPIHRPETVLLVP